MILHNKASAITLALMASSLGLAQTTPSPGASPTPAAPVTNLFRPQVVTAPASSVQVTASGRIKIGNTEGYRICGPATSDAATNPCEDAKPSPNSAPPVQVVVTGYELARQNGELILVPASSNSPFVNLGTLKGLDTSKVGTTPRLVITVTPPKQ